MNLEKSLQEIVSSGKLLHGSRIDIMEDFILPGKRGIICATQDPRLALIRAILSNKNCNLAYYNNISLNQPFKVTLESPNKYTIGEYGFVYVLSSAGFEKNVKTTWEYIKKRPAQILQKIEVKRQDVVGVYPIVNGITGKFIE